MTVNRHSWLAVAVLAFMATLMVIVLVSQPAHAAGPWYVAPGGSDGNTCLSAVSPCATINGALGKISPGDTVLVATGTYTGTGTEVVSLNISTTLSGGWNSGFIAQTGMSTIDGQGARRGVTVNNGVTAIIKRFTAQNGFLSYSGGDGIFNSGALTLSDSIVSSNKNGIYNDYGTLALNNSTINGNTDRGIINNLGSMTISNSTINGNSTEINGAGIFNFGMMTISNTTISGNNITSSGSGGGGGSGIYTENGVLTLNNSTVSGNTILGDFPGSGINNVHGMLTLNNSTVSGNTNQYGNGGGISNSSVPTFNSVLILNNSTVSGNTAKREGGGIYNEGASGVTVTLQNSILAGNITSSTGSDCSGSIGSSGYNLIGNTSGCAFAPGVGDLINIAARLGPLQDNGGSTLTQALLPGSPAINAGNPAGCTNNSGAPLPFDQRGYLRIGRCDIGAYEYGSSPSLFITKGVVGRFQPSGLVTYTLTLIDNVPNIDLTNVSLSDPLPTQVTYIPNSLAVTNGDGAVNNGAVAWTGTVFSNTATVITFAAMISPTAQNMVIANTATSNWGGYTFSAAATFDTFSHHIYLPLITRNY
jgi:uncharacterized repeat protein (TIGR01451 family)